MDAKDDLDLLNPKGKRNRALVNLIACVAHAQTVVHGTLLRDYPLVRAAGVDVMTALLAHDANTALVVSVFDGWTQKASSSLRGVVVAERRDFPPHLQPRLEDAVLMVRHCITKPHTPDDGMTAVAFLRSGLILTVNEPYGHAVLNVFDGVPDTE